MTTRSFAPGERFDTHTSDYQYNGYSIHGRRKPGEMSATIKASGRSNADDRDSIAASMATLTESWIIETVIPRREWRVHFSVTHKIVPIID